MNAERPTKSNQYVDLQKFQSILTFCDDPPELSILIGGWYWVADTHPSYPPYKAKVVAADCQLMSFVVQGPQCGTRRKSRSDFIGCVLPEDWPVPFCERVRRWFAWFCSTFL